MSAFLALVGRSFAALDAAFGECLTITPQAAGEFTSTGPDPDQPAYDLTGILDTATVIIEGGGEQTADRSEINAQVPTADFAFAAFEFVPMPQVGWRVDAAPNRNRPPPTAFQIVSRLPDGDDGRVRFQLAPLA